MTRKNGPKRSTKESTTNGVKRGGERSPKGGSSDFGEPFQERRLGVEGEVKRGARRVSSDLKEAKAGLEEARKQMRRAGKDLREAIARVSAALVGREERRTNGRKSRSAESVDFQAKPKPRAEKLRGKAQKTTAKARESVRKVKESAKMAGDTVKSVAASARARSSSGANGKRPASFSSKAAKKKRGEPFSEKPRFEFENEGTTRRSRNGEVKAKSERKATGPQPARPQPEDIPATRRPLAKKKGPASKASGRMSTPGSIGQEPGWGA